MTDEENGPILKDSVKTENEEILLEDNPKIIEEFEDYINKKWLDDLIPFKKQFEEYHKQMEVYKKLATTYKQFFSIYNKAEQFGEEYELIIGVGLLNFKEDDSSPKILRHFFTQKIDISFEYEKSSSTIVVGPNIESTIQIETDSIMELREQFDSQNINEAEDLVKKFFLEKETSSIFDNIEDAIQMFAERVSPDGIYKANIERPKETFKKPTFSFSPCLILRKRDTKSYTALFKRIIDNIDNSDGEIDIPTLDDLIGIPTNITANNNSTSDNESYNLQPIFFPKEYNDEQIEIVEKIRHNNKVLVQGPPGTGKSHTIANLICHLLANGKKVLVTAYTQRALEVLREKLPKEFQDLAVNYLSGDASSIRELQSSVNAINSELSNTNLDLLDAAIIVNKAFLKETKKEIAEKINQILNIQEKATRKQEINAVYKGTLLEIAEKLEKDAILFEWYKDDFYDIEDDKILSQLTRFVHLHESYKVVDTKVFNLDIPVLDKLITANQLKEYYELIQKTSSNSFYVNEKLKDSCSDIDQLAKKLEYLQKQLKYAKKFFSYFSRTFQDYFFPLSRQEHKNILKWTNEILENLEARDLRKIDRDIDISYPKDKSLKQIKEDAQTLYKYLKEGNSLTGFPYFIKKPFLSNRMKKCLYLVTTANINGKPLNNLERFRTILRDIEIQQEFIELSKLWRIDIPKEDSLIKKLEYFKRYYQNTLSFSNHIKILKEIKNQIESDSNLEIDLFDNDSITESLQMVDNIKTMEWVKGYEDSIKKSRRYLENDKNYHSITKKIIEAYDNVDYVGYDEILGRVRKLMEEKLRFLQFKDLRAEILKKIPIFLHSIEDNTSQGKEIKDLKAAIFFKNAHYHLNKLMEEDYEDQLIHELKSLEKKERDLTSVLASKMAWFTILDKLKDDRSLRRHLNAWVMAVKKIGKTGRGKRAMKFRKVAQKEMEYCKDTVPCWVMPLYKVAETIQPEQGMYDYAIIDEASQIGPDAIFLLYIAKNIIIVGDDKQTSPEYVGINANIMSPYIKKHLNEIPSNDFYGTEFSFFDHAKLFCNGVNVVLREHFRCMPEIIEFSNRNFYAPDGKPLYPLKQYSENRLEPLKTVFCQDGYTEGRGSRIINEPEAEKIVNTINDLVSDEKYEDKTIGVITLQGNQQARLIEDRLINSIGEKEFHNRKIICGNSTSFQGDERDIIILSLVTAHNHNRSALTRPEDERRFNVAVSRAKEQAWLFHSIQLEDLSNTNDLRYKVLDHFQNYDSYQRVFNSPIKRELGTQPPPFDSWFEVDVYNDIVNKGMSIIPQYQIAKGRYRIDLVALLPDGTKLAIECDGDKWHGPEQYQNDIMRQKVLERCGWQFFRVRGYEYYSNREKALEPFWKIVETHSLLKQEKEEKPQNISVIKNDIEEIELDLSQGSNNQILDSDFSENTEDSNTLSPAVIDEVETTDTKIIRYLNLYKSGIYVLTTDKGIETADYIIPIKDNEAQGFLLQCYATGHINKVNISALLSKRLDREYMNGLNTESELSLITVIPYEKIMGIYYRENGEKKFKAHLTENISARDQSHLKGMKVMYNNFDSIQFKVFPLSMKESLKTLLRSSFTANGASLNNAYYSDVWKALKPFNFNNAKEIEELIPTASKDELNGTLFEKRVSLGKIIYLQFSNNPTIIKKIRLVEFETKSKEIESGVQLVNYRKPLGQSIFDRAIGESVNVGSTENKVKIINIE